MNDTYKKIERGINSTRTYSIMPYPYNNPMDVYRGVCDSIDGIIDQIKMVSVHMNNNLITKLIIEHDKGTYNHVFELAPVIEETENTEEV